MKAFMKIIMSVSIVLLIIIVFISIDTALAKRNKYILFRVEGSEYYFKLIEQPRDNLYYLAVSNNLEFLQKGCTCSDSADYILLSPSIEAFYYIYCLKEYPYTIVCQHGIHSVSVPMSDDLLHQNPPIWIDNSVNPRYAEISLQRYSRKKLYIQPFNSDCEIQILDGKNYCCLP